MIAFLTPSLSSLIQDRDPRDLTKLFMGCGGSATRPIGRNDDLHLGPRTEFQSQFRAPPPIPPKSSELEAGIQPTSDGRSSFGDFRTRNPDIRDRPRILRVGHTQASIPPLARERRYFALSSSTVPFVPQLGTMAIATTLDSVWRHLRSQSSSHTCFQVNSQLYQPSVEVEPEVQNTVDKKMWMQFIELELIASGVTGMAVFTLCIVCLGSIITTNVIIQKRSVQITGIL